MERRSVGRAGRRLVATILAGRPYVPARVRRSFERHGTTEAWVERPARLANAESAFEVIGRVDLRFSWWNAREEFANELDGACRLPATSPEFTLFVKRLPMPGA